MECRYPYELFADEVASSFQTSLIHAPIEIVRNKLRNEHGAKLSPQIDTISKYKEIVHVCLDLNIDVNVAETKYSALLHFVVDYKLDPETLKTVLERSSDFNINAVYKGRALFHVIIYQDNSPRVEVIEIEMGGLDINTFTDYINCLETEETDDSNLEISTEEDDTALNYAKVLLEFGADVNVKDPYGRTPLYYAVSGKNAKLVRLLLDNGAKFQDGESSLKNFFVFYDSSTDKEIVKMLLEEGREGNPGNNDILPIDSIFFKDGTSNFFNCERNIKNWEIVKIMCAYGAGIYLKNEIGTNILHSFCKKGRLEDVLFSVKHGADLFSKQNDSTTLHRAVLTNNFDLVEFLLRQGVNINDENCIGETPLHLLAELPDMSDRVTENRSVECIEKEYVDMIEFLVDNGADVNALSDFLSPPLSCSLYYNLLDISECFLELKATFYSVKTGNLICGKQSAEIISKKCRIFEVFIAFLALKNDNISQYIDRKSNPNDYEWVEPFFQKCKTEIKEMKRRNICQDRNIFFFDFLSKDLMEVTILSRNEELKLVLESGEYKKEFPSYEYLLGKRIQRVQLLRNSINLFVHFLGKFFNNKLPVVVLDKILSLLSAKDLRLFARATRLTK